MLNVGDVGRDLLGAVRGLLHIAGDFLRRRALLLDPEAIADAISDIRPMVSPISLMAPTDSCVAA